MQFNSDSDNQDIISDISFLTGADTNKYSLKDRTRNVNERFKMLWHIIFEAYGGWLFMDDNSSDASTGVPYADQTLTSGTDKYVIPTGSLYILGVDTYDGSSRNQLAPLTIDQFIAMGGDARFPTTGVPEYYLLQGDVIRILPSPNFTQASTGLRVHFGAGISAFASTDTTKVPGFASAYHRALSVGASLDYANIYDKKKVPQLQALWNDYEQRIREFYAHRYKQLIKRIRTGVDLKDEYS